MRSNNTSSDIAAPANSPTPAPDKPPALPPPGPRFTHADWKRKVLQNMNSLEQTPDFLLALRKRAF